MRKTKLNIRLTALAAAAALLMTLLSGCGVKNGRNSGKPTAQPVNTDAVAIVTDAPAVTDVSAATDAPVATDVSNVTSDPVSTATPAPDASKVPAVTEVPVETDAPDVTGAPSSAPSVTPAPTATPAPTSTALPTPTADAQPTTDDGPILPTGSGPFTGLSGKTWDEYPYLESESEFRVIVRMLTQRTNDGMSLPDKIRAAHDWIALTYRYDTTLKSRHLSSMMSTGAGICQAYAELFYVCMGELGVPCRIISGTAKGESHAWNAVQLGDEWYYVDVTWDDPLICGHSDYPDGTNLRYTYLMVPLTVISKDHTAESELPAPAGTSTEYNEQAGAAREAEVRGELEARIAAGQVENGFIVSDAADLENVMHSIADALIEQAGRGDRTFTFTLYYKADELDFKTVSDCAKSILLPEAAEAFMKATTISLNSISGDYYSTLTGTLKAQ